MNYTFYAYFKFLTELIAATAMFVFPLKRRKYFFLKLVLCLGVCYGFSRIHSYELSLIFVWRIFRYTMIFMFVCAAVYILFDVRLKNAVFFGISGYAVQFFTNKLFGFIESFFLSEVSFAVNLVAYIIVFACCYIAFFFLFRKKINENVSAKIERSDLLLCYIALVFVTIVLNSVIDLYVQQLNIWGSLVYMAYGMIFSVLLLCLQSGIFTKGALKAEIRQMSQIWEIERRQMETSKASIELINVKCHDMKNMIASYGKKFSDEDVKELQSLISVYDMSVKTGNSTLDLIIAEKSLYMEQQKIKFTCVADGAAMNFMSSSDIYSLFGNALNNAVEAVSKIADLSERVIVFNIKRALGIISVHVENYFDGELRFKDGRIATSKDDDEYHGFGTRSIELITEKYGGSLSVNTENGIYKLDIAFIEEEVAKSEDVDGIDNRR